MVDFKDAMDAATRTLLTERGGAPRPHLGASVIGGKCARKAWYTFRWVRNVDHTGRIRRLFSRGHEEEFRIVKWMRAMGIEVQDYSERLCWYNGPEHITRYKCVPWEDEVPAYFEDVSHSQHHITLATEEGLGPKQWNFRGDIGTATMPEYVAAHGNVIEEHKTMSHFAGSSDGRIRGVEEWYPEVAGLGWGLSEYKTHSEKSFKELLKKGVLSSKPEHYIQMQVYMKYMKCKWGLYLAVNKNNDEIYVEIIHYKEEVGEQIADKAGDIIQAQHAPKRYTEDSTWFECKFCDFREICHKGADVEKNCRSCAYAEAAEDGQWQCNLHRQTIPKEFHTKGCDKWVNVQ